MFATARTLADSTRVWQESRLEPVVTALSWRLDIVEFVEESIRTSPTRTPLQCKSLHNNRSHSKSSHNTRRLGVPTSCYFRMMCNVNDDTGIFETSPLLQLHQHIQLDHESVIMHKQHSLFLGARSSTRSLLCC